MKILIIDDHPLFRKGLKDVLEKDANNRIIGEADNGRTALLMIKMIKPDVVFLDLSMPKLNGLEVLKKLADEKSLLKIVITSYTEQEYVEKAFELGANAYILKDDNELVIQNCLELVKLGEQFISPNIGAESKSNYLGGHSDEKSKYILNQLTHTELIVMSHLAEFLTSKEIANKMFISYRTVQNHRRNIKQKLELSGMHQLTKLAQQYRNNINQYLNKNS